MFSFYQVSKQLASQDLLPRKRFRFQFPASKVRLSNIGHLLRAGRLLFGCCPDSEMGLCSIWFQNNWLHKVHNHKKVSFPMFSIFDTHCSAAIQGSSAACWQVTVWMLFRIGNVFSFYLVENNWLHKGPHKEKF